MFFPVSKIFWALCAPSHVLLWCSLLAAMLLLRRRWRGGTVFALLSAGLLVAMGAVPSYIWLGRGLEHQFDGTPIPAHVDGILILAGGDADMLRLPAAMMLARQHPEARVVFSGGSGALINNRPDIDARHARMVLLRLGLDPARLTLEGQSRNTDENFLFTRAIVKPQPQQVWALVTSAYHMPRSLQIAARQHWKMLPWPSDYLTPRHGMDHWLDIPDNLQAFDMICHEQIGLLAYRWTGRSSGA